MIDIYDSETIVKCYKLLNKKCKIIDKFINNHAFYFGTSAIEMGSLDVCNNIINLMERKNQLINFKLIIDNTLNRLDEDDRKILLIKMHYNLPMEQMCGVLNLKERTAFRRIERAFVNLSEELNYSKYRQKIEQVLTSEEWLVKMKESIKSRRQSFKAQKTELNNLQLL